MTIIFGLNCGYMVLNLCIVVVQSCMMERKEAEVQKYQPAETPNIQNFSSLRQVLRHKWAGGSL